jgi:Kef-type K+ transport system membrane component KefB
MGEASVDVRLLLAVAAVITAARVVGVVAARFGQPRVLGEILAGVLLGPSLLGAVAPSVSDYLFPAGVRAGLGAIAQLGLVLFMFIVGLELDVSRLTSQGRRAVVISQMSIFVPLVLGVVLGLWLYPRFGTGSGQLGFVLFIGAAMAITAFPVLVLVMREAGLDGTRLGALAITCAAIDDVTAWCLLAAVVAVVQADGGDEVLLTVLLAAAFVVAMLGLARPLMNRRSRISLPAAVAFALLCAWTTEAIGIHAIFGAFLAGVVIQHSPVAGRELASRLDSATTVVLLPVFFVVVGLSTQIGLLDSTYRWAVAALVVAVAMVGKLGGGAFAARLTGESWRDAMTIGVLMNTRGLTEIVILTVALDLGVIGPTLFTIMVMMALATTFMAAPLLRWIRRSAPDPAPS